MVEGEFERHHRLPGTQGTTRLTVTGQTEQTEPRVKLGQVAPEQSGDADEPNRAATKKI